MSFFCCFIIRDSALTFNESVQTSLLFFCWPTLTHIFLSLPHSLIEPGSHCDKMFFAYNIKSCPKHIEVSLFFLLAFRHFWAACDCDTKIFFVILQAHILQITQTSMPLIEKAWGNEGWNHAASLYLFNWRRRKWLCTCQKTKIRVILPLPFIHHSFIRTLLQPWKVLGLGAQDLGSKEEETMPGMWWGKEKKTSHMSTSGSVPPPPFPKCVAFRSPLIPKFSGRICDLYH